MSRNLKLPKDAAQYYDWLVGQSYTLENQIKQVPKISLEEQAKQGANASEYTTANLKTVNQLLARKNQIEMEARRIVGGMGM